MMKKITLLAALAVSISSFSADLPFTPVWNDAETAAKEVEHFDLIGEYVSSDGKTAVQANILNNGQFLVATYNGGLPGAGWDQSAIQSELMDAAGLKTKLNGYRKTVRTSPTIGEKIPDNAFLKMPGDFTNIREDGYMLAGGKTTKDIGSFKMHLEFFMPLKPGRNLSSQDRGNSGIYIFNNYEVQIIDSFALDYENPENNANKLESVNKQWCGSLYKMKLPDVNMTLPPLQWQTYDIEFTAPVLDDETKVKNARITVYHNGVKIHDDFELETGTGIGATRKPLAKGPIFFQNHGNPVLFRNVWAVEL